MLLSIERTLRRWPAAVLLLLAGGLMLLVGWLDAVTGYELSFSIFYLLPIALVTWYRDRRQGLAACLLSALIWSWAEFSAGREYSHPSLPWWNAAVRLGFFVVVTLLLARLRETLEAQRLLAQRDGLTGLLNARSFREHWERMVAGGAGSAKPFALALVDLDGFKAVNDRMGHAAGDLLLQGVARALQQELPVAAVLARLGGDEFGVLVVGVTEDEAATLFEQLQRRLRARMLEQQWPIGFSIGVLCQGRDAIGYAVAMRQADQLMYQAKQAGKDRVCLASGSTPQSV